MHGTASGPHQEIEIKLELGSANLPDLKKISLLRTVKPTPKAAPQVSVYFDTNNQKLRKKGLMCGARVVTRRKPSKQPPMGSSLNATSGKPKSRGISRISIRPTGLRSNRF